MFSVKSLTEIQHFDVSAEPSRMSDICSFIDLIVAPQVNSKTEASLRVDYFLTLNDLNSSAP